MADNRKKKTAGKGAKQKKTSASRRPFYFNVAATLLAVFVVVLLVLTLIHQARVKAWFSPGTEQTRSVAKADKDRLSLKGKQATAFDKPRPSQISRSDKSPLQDAVRTPVVESRNALTPPESGTDPQAAIIVDDLGDDPVFMRELLAIDLSLTAAVLPTASHAREIAQLAHQAGREVIIHLPMEPKDYPTSDPGKEPLFVNLPARELQNRMRDYISAVPYAVGANNHMGSKFTEDREGMSTVLTAIGERGMYFVDSRTTAATVAYDEAVKLKIPVAERDVFLDNERTVAAISAQIRELAAVARKRGRAIGICHPYPETLAALEQEVSYLAQQGVRIVPASQIVQ